MKQVEHTNSEREMLVRVRHPFLVNLWGTFQDVNNLYMVMDFVAGGELFSLLRKSQRFPNSVAKFYAAEVALALDYLHSLDIIYRDLKPENLLLGSDGHVKVTDFGFAKHVPDITWTLCGTPDYCEHGRVPTLWPVLSDNRQWLQKSSNQRDTTSRLIGTPWVSSSSKCSYVLLEPDEVEDADLLGRLSTILYRGWEPYEVI